MFFSYKRKSKLFKFLFKYYYIISLDEILSRQSSKNTGNKIEYGIKSVGNKIKEYIKIGINITKEYLEMPVNMLQMQEIELEKS